MRLASDAWAELSEARGSGRSSIAWCDHLMASLDASFGRASWEAFHALVSEMKSNKKQVVKLNMPHAAHTPYTWTRLIGTDKQVRAITPGEAGSTHRHMHIPAPPPSRGGHEGKGMGRARLTCAARSC